MLFERSEFLIDTSPKKVCACARVPACRVHVCNNLGFSVVLCTTYVRTWYQLVISRLPRYVYVYTYVPGWGTYYVPHMFVNWCEHAIIAHKPKRTATSTRTIHTRQNKPYRLGAAPAGVVGTPSRRCAAATVPAPVIRLRSRLLFS